MRTAEDVTDLDTSNIRADMASKYFTDGHSAPEGPVSDYNIVAILDLGVESLSDETGLTDNLNETPDITSNVNFASGLFALTNGSSEAGDVLVLRENPLNPEQVTELRYAFDSDEAVRQSRRLPLAEGVALEHQNPSDDPTIVIDMPGDLPPGHEFEMPGMRTTITYQDDAGIPQIRNKWTTDTGLDVRLDMGDFDDLRATLDDLPPDAVVSYGGFVPHNVSVDGIPVPGPDDAPATPGERIDLSLHDLSAGPVRLTAGTFQRL